MNQKKRQRTRRKLNPMVRVTVRATGNYELPPLGYLYKVGDEYMLRSVNDGVHGITIRDGDTISLRIHNPNTQAEGRLTRKDNHE